MARMYPAVFPEAFSHKKSREELAFDALSALPDDVRVFYEPALPLDNGLEVCPDFVVVIPDSGVFVLESKNWKEIVASDGSEVIVRKSDGKTFQAKHPLKQARRAMYALKDLIRKESALRNDKGIVFPLMYGLIWLNSSDDDPARVAEKLKAANEEQIVTHSILNDPDQLVETLEKIQTPYAADFSPEHTERLAKLIGNQLGSFEEFEKRRHEFGEAHDEFVTIAADLAADVNVDDIVAGLEKSKEHLRSGQFNIALFGSFSCGKTTLLNGLLSGLQLPTGINPTTAVTTLVRSEEAISYRVVYRDRKSIEQLNSFLPEEFQLDPTFPKGSSTAEFGSVEEMATHIREGEEGAYIEFAEVAASFEELPAGVQFVDLPGTDSTNPVHRIIAEIFIPQVDLIVFVINGEHPLGEAEGEILKSMCLSGKTGGFNRFLFFVNAMDKVLRPKEVLNHIKEVLSEQYGFAEPKVISGSARLAELSLKEELSDQEEDDAENMMIGLSDEDDVGRDQWRHLSGFEVLEKTIEALLAETRGRLLLQGTAEELWKGYDSLSVRIRPLVEKREEDIGSVRERLEQIKESAQTGDFMGAREEINNIYQRTKAALEESANSFQILEHQMNDVLDTLTINEEKEAVNERLGRQVGDFLSGRRENVVSAINSMRTTQLSVMRRASIRATGKLDEFLSTDSGSIPFCEAENTEIDISVELPEFAAGDVGFKAAILVGLAMGAVPGAIFPGVGNLVGAAIGAVIAGIGVFFVQRKREIQQTREGLNTEIDQLKWDFQKTVLSALEQAHSVSLKELEQLEKEFGSQVDAVEESFDVEAGELKERIEKFRRLSERLDAARERTDELCEKAKVLTYGEWKATSRAIVPYQG
jgi:GTPase SAR1 family protein